MSTISLDLEEDVVALLRQTNPSLERAARELIVVELYRRGAISGGKAAELLGMDRYDFIRHASALGIAYFSYTEEEWKAEMEAAEELAACHRSSVTPAR